MENTTLMFLDVQRGRTEITIARNLRCDAAVVAANGEGDDENFLQRIDDRPNFPIGLKANLETLS
jgi:hypothetical protein